MKFGTWPLAALCLLAPPLLALGGESSTYSFDCDAPAAHSSSWSRTTSAKDISISANLKIIEVRKDKKWLATTYVALLGGADGRKSFGVTFYMSSTAPDTVLMQLDKPGGHIDIGSGSMPLKKKSIPFTLQISASGRLKATVGDAEAVTEIGEFSPSKIRVGCSTGDFEFTDIKVTEGVKMAEGPN